jgi:hypothetical protein
MIKQIVEINGRYYLRSWNLWWVYADSDDLLKGEEIYWWTNSIYFRKHCTFESLEILQESIEGYNMKRRELKEKEKAANSVKVVKTYWFKWL